MIFIGYTQRLGRVDVDGIEKYRKDNDVEKIVIFCREKPVEKVKELAKDYEIVITDSPIRDARNKAKELKKDGKVVEIFDLQDFGERVIRDVC